MVDMREEFLETRKHATFSRALIEAIRGAAGKQRAGHGAAQPARIFELRGLPFLRRAHRVHELRGDADLASARPPSALPLLRLCGKGAVGLSEVRERAHPFPGLGRSAWRTSCTASFPTARIARLDRDTVTGKRQFEDILQNFRERNFDMLVGTQMIAKGHDIPNVTLVGVVSADVGLGMPDFRAAERTFQLLTQVAGRAGRGDLPGIVLHADHQSGSLRGAAGGAAGLSGVLRKGTAVPPLHEVSAVQRHGQHAGARGEAGGCAADEHRTGPSSDARAGEYENHGTGRSAGAAVEGRVPLSVADQVGKPEGC